MICPSSRPVEVSETGDAQNRRPPASFRFEHTADLRCGAPCSDTRRPMGRHRIGEGCRGHDSAKAYAK